MGSGMVNLIEMFFHARREDFRLTVFQQTYKWTFDYQVQSCDFGGSRRGLREKNPGTQSRYCWQTKRHSLQDIASLHGLLPFFKVSEGAHTNVPRHVSTCSLRWRSGNQNGRPLAVHRRTSFLHSRISPQLCCLPL